MTSPSVWSAKAAAPALLAALFLSLIHSACLAAAPIRFFHVGSEEGLPQVTIRSLLKSRTGQVWAGTEDGLARLDGASVTVFKKSARNPASLSDNCISALAEGPDGVVWAGVLGNGLNAISPDGASIRRVQAPSIAHADILCILPDDSGLWLGTGSGLKFLPYGGEDAVAVELRRAGAPHAGKVRAVARGRGCLWAATKGQGLARLTPEGEARWFGPGDNGLEEKSFNTLFTDASGRVWAGGENAGLVEIIEDADGVRFRHYTKARDGLGASDVMAVADAGQGRLWVGSWEGGLQLFEPGKGVLDTYKSSPADPTTLSSDIVTAIVTGDGPDVWVGTNERGLSRFDRDQAFKSFTYNPMSPSGLPNPLVWCFAQDSLGRLWAGTSKGSALLDPRTSAYLPPALSGEIAKESVRAYAPFPGGMWISVRKSGVVRLDFATGEVTSISQAPGVSQALANNEARLLLLDPERRELWIGLSQGLLLYDTATGAARRFGHDPSDPSSLPHDRIRALHRDGRGRIWVGTSLGLALLKEDRSGFTVWKHDPAKPDASLAGYGARCVAEDGTGRYWVATETGVTVLSPDTGEVRNLREEDGLPNGAVYGIVASGGFMWASTMRGLARIDPATFAVLRYFKRDGLPDNEFNFNAWGRLQTGELLFGTVNGFVMFAPGSVPCPENARKPPRIVLSASPPSGSVEENGATRLGWRSPNMDFRFSALAFEPPGNIVYRVRLAGAETGWREGGETQASYVGLSPGVYDFEVEARETHGQWSAGPEHYRFVVESPPWLGWPAFAAYALLLAGLMALLARAASARQARRAAWLETEVAKRSAQLAESHALLEERNASLARLMEAREKLFRSIAHELRTPLAVIVTALERNMESFQGKAAQAAQLALKCSMRLSNLIKAVLDVSRGESRRRETVFEAAKALEETLAPFRLMAETLGKRIEEDTSRAAGAWVSMDRELFIAAVGNLLSNALKYGRSSVRVEARAESGELRVDVLDDGGGVAPEDLPRVFEWFSRGQGGLTSEGWGIGLPTAREAVERHGGSIEARRPETGGMLFGVRLPLAPPPGDADAFDRSPAAGAPNVSALSGRKVVLVEDDEDLSGQLASLLGEHCQVSAARDAEEAWKLIASTLPDLVVSDVMLPGRSGFELVREVKERLDTCHIPVVLISAYDEEEVRRTGFEQSADACLGKPFSPDELLRVAAALVRNRELAAQRLRRAVLFEPALPEPGDIPTMEAPEKDVLERIREAFTPQDFAQELSLGDVAGRLGMSPRSLQRAFERAGINWRDFKRLNQLRHAMELLRASGVSVTEAAMQSGFGSPAYFAKVFKDHVGETPSEWRARQRP